MTAPIGAAADPLSSGMGLGDRLSHWAVQAAVAASANWTIGRISELSYPFWSTHNVPRV